MDISRQAQHSANTEELSAQVEEVVASSTMLKDLAVSLKDSVAVFTPSDIKATDSTKTETDVESDPEVEVDTQYDIAG